MIFIHLITNILSFYYQPEISLSTDKDSDEKKKNNKHNSLLSYYRTTLKPGNHSKDNKTLAFERKSQF